MSEALRINNHPISEEELLREWQLVKDKLMEGGGLVEGVDDVTLKYAKENIIKRILIEDLVEEEVEEVDFKEIQTEYRKMIEHFGGKEKFQEHFSRENTSAFKIKANIEKSIKVNRLLDRWRKEGAALINEEELIVYYEQNQPSFRQNAGVRVDKISLYLKKTEELVEGESELELKFRQEYEVLLKDKDEEKFCHQIDDWDEVEIKRNILIEYGYLPKELEDSLNNLDDHQFTGLIRNDEGIHFFKKLETIRERQLDYEEARPQVELSLKNYKQNNYINSKIAELRQKAIVEDLFQIK